MSSRREQPFKVITATRKTPNLDMKYLLKLISIDCIGVDDKQ